MTHSPFLVSENFISPLQCESIAANLALQFPNVVNGEPLKHERFLPGDISGSILAGLDSLRPVIEQHFSGQIVTDPLLKFQQYFENARSPAEAHFCEAYKFTRKKWVKTKDITLIGYLWLKSFHNKVPLDPRTEVYGGKLEFPAYDFSLVPVQGALVLFPAVPNFITAVSHILVGSLEQIKIGVKLTVGGEAWQYDQAKFPGTYRDWFAD